MRITGLFTTVVVLAAVAGVCQGGERLSGREQRRVARKRARKARQKVVEAQPLTSEFRDTTRLTPRTEGKSGRIDDTKMTDRRLDDNLARQLRQSRKAEKGKVGETDLTAVTEEEERRAREREEARKKRIGLQKKRKVDLTIFFDW